MITKGAKYPLMYEENPQSVLILPPINKSTAADAKEYYSTTIQEPLSLSGFYTFPYEVTSEDFRKRSRCLGIRLVAVAAAFRAQRAQLQNLCE